ncbi:hypothetical protein OIE62_24670 [Streptomyces scopuliridis]|uniref:Uncharacterized protein n=1 Tax=Streptomyces scopuliridis TaxID=452529 RepID=A0ACD4ZJQ6_9ACTN|nr:hypothetical protein [Streptomyces scopuliridis]WSB34165.1 hypothetical protein OG949_15655 [Streptomyces scopuliridis]WSB98428.1 hypothetical protein OG835_16275 [Streptomyces scopuliridis]WSC07871.1 hypothetical protein OIE62_24670 [Streptomyces scopuliridis]
MRIRTAVAAAALAAMAVLGSAGAASAASWEHDGRGEFIDIDSRIKNSFNTVVIFGDK